MVKAKTGAERRRSVRIERRISVRLTGEAKDGQRVNEVAESTQVSFHGARIVTANEYRPGIVVTLEGMNSHDTARYRVVWAYQDKDSPKWNIGLELVTGQPTVWGIDFAALEKEKKPH
jgi:hypothetical protein